MFAFVSWMVYFCIYFKIYETQELFVIELDMITVYGELGEAAGMVAQL